LDGQFGYAVPVVTLVQERCTRGEPWIASKSLAGPTRSLGVQIENALGSRSDYLGDSMRALRSTATSGVQVPSRPQKQNYQLPCLQLGLFQTGQ
jgi:hypothetical protein